MKTFHSFVGIDISKLTLDASLLQAGEPNKITHCKVTNDSKGLNGLIRQLSKKTGSLEDTLFVCGDTGIYTTPLMTAMRAAWGIITGLLLPLKSSVHRLEQGQKR